MPKRSNFSEAQIIGAVREIEGGAKMVDVSRRVGVSTQTMMRWKQKYSGMDVPEAREKKRLEEENARLKKLVAQFALEVDSLKVALGKKW